MKTKHDKIVEIWNEYKAFLKVKYPPEKGKEFEFTCPYHKRIDKLLAQQNTLNRDKVMEVLKEYLPGFGLFSKDVYWNDQISLIADALCSLTLPEQLEPEDDFKGLDNSFFFNPPPQQPSEARIDELADEYSKGHYTDSESIKQAYDDYYIGFKAAIEELTPQQPSEGEIRACPCTYLDEPCKENCTCKNKFSSAGCEYCCNYGSVEQRKAKAEYLQKKLTPQQPSEGEIHYQALQDCCNDLLTAVDNKKVPVRQINRLRILLNRPAIKELNKK